MSLTVMSHETPNKTLFFFPQLYVRRYDKETEATRYYESDFRLHYYLCFIIEEAEMPQLVDGEECKSCRWDIESAFVYEVSQLGDGDAFDDVDELGGIGGPGIGVAYGVEAEKGEESAGGILVDVETLVGKSDDFAVFQVRLFAEFLAQAVEDRTMFFFVDAAGHEAHFDL